MTTSTFSFRELFQIVFFKIFKIFLDRSDFGSSNEELLNNITDCLEDEDLFALGIDFDQKIKLVFP
jgi:hypothetical protein